VVSVPSTVVAHGSRRPSSRRRAELLSIAADLFAERGFANVTVDDIGAAAGVSGPALYHHFDSKESVLGEMLIGISEHLLSDARSLRESSRPERLLDDLVAMHVDFAVDRRSLITVHFRDLPSASQEDQRRVRALQRQYAEIWVRALVERRPGLTASSARPAVHAVFGLINSTPFSTRSRRAEMVRMLRGMAHGAFGAVVAPADGSPFVPGGVD
jgi:AcrR family transcriptional regulator